MMRRLLAVLRARNLEFVRDRSSLGWNIMLPVLLVLGLAFIFSGDQRPMFKVAVLAEAVLADDLHPFLDSQYVDFFPVNDVDRYRVRLARHQVDMLLDLRQGEPRYWINTQSAKGYFLDKLIRADPVSGLQGGTVTGTEIRYVDWLVPGVLGMNMTFSALFGVGYVIVRYRKSGYLKRLHATPLTALEFLLAQVLSRLILIMAISSGVFMATNAILNFPMEGRYLDLFLIAALGAVSMIALGLTIASRVESEELAGGLLNLVSWPMMLVSGVWFSLDGAHPWIQTAAQIFPLTHVLEGARAIMLDGLTLSDLSFNVGALVLMSVVFLALGAGLFKWAPD